MSTASPPPADSARHKRVHVRHSCGAATAAHVALQESCIFQPVRVLDMSAGGIALLLWEPLTKGDEVFIQLTNRDDETTQEIAAKVANVQEPKKGKWLVGLCFERPLTPAELARFV